MGVGDWLKEKAGDVKHFTKYDYKLDPVKKYSREAGGAVKASIKERYEEFKAERGKEKAYEKKVKWKAKKQKIRHKYRYKPGPGGKKPGLGIWEEANRPARGRAPDPFRANGPPPKRRKMIWD